MRKVQGGTVSNTSSHNPLFMICLDYILLEDLTHGYVHPSVMDIKIGKVTYLPSFTKQKIDECIEKARTSTQSTDAHRVCGLQVNPGIIDELGVCDN